jgi:hypothetical protein
MRSSSSLATLLKFEFSTKSQRLLFLWVRGCVGFLCSCLLYNEQSLRFFSKDNTYNIFIRAANITKMKIQLFDQLLRWVSLDYLTNFINLLRHYKFACKFQFCPHYVAKINTLYDILRKLYLENSLLRSNL